MIFNGNGNNGRPVQPPKPAATKTAAEYFADALRAFARPGAKKPGAKRLGSCCSGRRK